MRFALATTCWAALGAASAASAAGLGDGLYCARHVFSVKSTGRSLGEFYTQMRTTMPQESPGSLTEGQYLDILAYILEQNDYPAGGADLANASGELDTVVFSAF